MSETYSVVLTGKVAANFSMAQVKTNLGKLFKLNDAQLNKLMCGKPVALQRGISREKATKLRAVLASVGALAVVKAGKAAVQAAPHPSAVKRPATKPAPAKQPVRKKPVAPKVAVAKKKITCPRCGHEQIFATACGLCKMDLSLHIQRLKRRDRVRRVRLQRQAQLAGR